MVPESLLQERMSSSGVVSPSPYMTGNPDLTSVLTYVAATVSEGTASYNAMQAVLQHRTANGLEGQISYTYSHCLTNSIGYYGDGGQASNSSAYWQNLYNPRAEWGSCYFDLHHNLTAHGVYELPFGHNKKFAANANPIANQLISGWTVSAIYTFHGGFPLTVYNWNDYSGTNSRGERANCNGKPRYDKKPTYWGIQWVDGSTYSNPSYGTFGSCGVSTLRGPGLDNIDLSVTREFKTFAGEHLEFRAEGLNALNHPVFNAPFVGCQGSAGGACASNFGIIWSTQGQRNVQLALKYYF
jgi:hypothetical protein